MLFLLSLLSLPAFAVPGQFTHQGRLLDDAGVGLEGERTMTFRLMDQDEGGSEVWSEALTVSLTNGFYVAILGQDEDENPLDISVLDQAPLWLEVRVGEDAPMAPRSPVNSVPYAQMAGVSDTIAGGTVDATEVAVSGSTVIDGDGRWVGSPLQWTDLEGVPSGFADGIDDDTVTTDTVLSGDEVRGHIDGAVLDLAAGSTVDGAPIASAGASDCIEGDVLRWDSATEEWVCTNDLDPSTTVGGSSILTTSSAGLVPSGMIAFFAASTCPAGWTEFTELQGRFVVGTPEGGSSGGSVGTAMTDEASLTTSSVVAHAHNVSPPAVTTDATEVSHSHGMAHDHEIDPPAVESNDVETSGSTGCTTVSDRWSNSGGCHWPSSCSSSYSVASCGSGSGVSHNHETDIPSFYSSDAGVDSTEASTASHSHVVENPDYMSDASGADAVDITPPYLQLMACIAP